MSYELRKFNLRSESDAPLTISAAEIPTLVPEKILKEWMDGDTDPYYKIQEIKYPVLANRYNYLESFFESFIGKLNRTAIPGSKSGHETSWGKRAATDLILVGAKLKSNGDGTGSVFFKNYIPKVGDSGDNSIFIKENKTGMVDYSIVAYTKDEVIENPDYSRTYNVIESMYGERNDAVGYGEGAMEQKSNNKEINKGEGMTKDEILKALLTLKTNLGITLPEVAKHLSLESLLITDQQVADIVKMNAIKKLCGEKDPVEMITEMQEAAKLNSDSVRSAKISEEFGPKEWDDTKKENKGRIFAEQVLEGKELTEESIKGVKENSLYISLAAERADVNSDDNDITLIDSKTKINATKVVNY